MRKPMISLRGGDQQLGTPLPEKLAEATAIH
jgi:hypothetical protein